MEKKNNLRIIAMTSLTIFTLASLFAATFAWFTSIMSAQSKDDGFHVSPVDTRLEKIEVFQNDGSDETQDKFSSAPVSTITVQYDNGNYQTTQEGTIDMQKYDSLDSPYNPLLFVLSLRDIDSASSFHVSGKTEYDFLGNKVISQKTTEGKDYIEKDDSTTYYPLSSVVRFYSGRLTEENYTNKNFTFPKPDTYQSFVTFNESTESNGSETEEYTFHPEITLFETQDTSSLKYVYIVMDYYPVAIDYIYSVNISAEGGAAVELGDLQYKCDWEMIL